MHCSYEHSRRRPNCPHVFNKQYICPASFDFILAGKSDDHAVKDVTMARGAVPPVTPARRTVTGTVEGSAVKGQQSTVKGKKIRISVAYDKQQNENVEQSNSLQSRTHLTQSTVSTPLNSKPKIILSSTAKKPSASVSALTDIFPVLKKETGILNWTMEELLDRLVKEKVGRFEEFLKEQQLEN